MDNRDRLDNIRRAKQKIYDICACNDWTWFVTLTLDQEEIDRTSVDEVTKKFQKWLNNKVNRNGLRYLFVFEYHKDQQGIHMHGVINDCDFKFTKAYHMNEDGSYRLNKLGRKIPLLSKKGKRQIYNIENWKYGHSTAIKVYGDVNTLSGYVTKYITKDSEKIAGHYYYAGGKELLRSPLEYVVDFPNEIIRNDDSIKMSQTVFTNSIGEPVHCFYHYYFDNNKNSEICKYLMDLALIEDLKRQNSFELNKPKKE